MPWVSLNVPNFCSGRLRAKKERHDRSLASEEPTSEYKGPSEDSSPIGMELAVVVPVEKAVGILGTKPSCKKASPVSSPGSPNGRQANGSTSTRKKSRKSSSQQESGATGAAKLFYVKDREADVDYLGESTKGDLNVRSDWTGILGK